MQATPTLTTLEPLDEQRHSELQTFPRMTEAEFIDVGIHKRLRAEWVDGEVIVMPPVSLIHTRLTIWLSAVLSQFVAEKKLGEVLGPEFLVRFSVQRRFRVPDLLFVANAHQNRLTATYLDGPPDLSLEVVSLDSRDRDRKEKFDEYQAAGVREYWIVDPLIKTIDVYALGPTGVYEKISPRADGVICSALIAGFYLNPEWLWMEKLPSPIQILREMGIQI